ncbi:MAG: carboxypeptidase-like regulatory domain-containing protein [Flavobacteriaceae bacterium]|nr:carboxypeptidase-like regulatory domain-containing protein [Flavobacteriaceae bacterium]
MRRLIILFLCFSTYQIFAQNVTLRVVDQSKNPIPFATIQTGKFDGVVSNSEGYFTISLDNIKNDKVLVSCMGYETKELKAQELKTVNLIVLEEYINQLGTVYLSNSPPDVETIMAEVRRNLDNNYSTDNLDYKVFFRNTSYITFENLDFEVDKASGVSKKKLGQANYTLDSLTNAIKNSNTVHFKEYLADFKIKGKNDYKISVVKATKLIDSKSDISVDQVQEKAQRVVFRYLDTTKTFKVKTGIIKIEDSMTLDDTSVKEDEQNRYHVEGLKNETFGLLKDSKNLTGSMLTHLIDADNYKFELKKVTYQNDELIYVIEFRPRKSKSKYAGTLYVGHDSYAVLRTDYSYAKGKRGSKLNLKLLLGIKYVENLRKGTMLFKKQEDGYYHPQYISEEDGNYFFVRRPIKFIENSPAKNQVRFDFTISGDTRERDELLIIGTNTLTPDEFTALKEEEYVEYIKLNKFDPSIWKEFTSLEPLEEMKKFKASQN